MTDEKYLNIYSAIRDILVIFADSEIGGEYEFNNDVIARYLDGKAIVDFWECNTKEEIYERFTQDIINGYPVWQMLILPEWTKGMIEKSFAEEVNKEEEEAKKIYKCLTCKHFCKSTTRFGMHYSCKRPLKRMGMREPRSGPFELKKACKYYEVADTETDEKGV